MAIVWRSLQTLVFSGAKRDAITTVNPVSSEWIRVEVKPLVTFRASWYRAGWMNQVLIIGGQPYLQRSQVVPFLPSIYQFSAEYPYKLRFKPVPYLPSSLIRIYRGDEQP